MGSKITIAPSNGVSAVGLTSIVIGFIMLVAGGVTWGMVSQQLANERISVSQDAPFLAGKQNVNDPFSAFAQAKAIEKHATEMSGGKTYAELDAADPVREQVMNASFLRASLFTSVVAFGVATFVMAVGIILMILGWAVRRLAGGPPVVIEIDDDGPILVDNPLDRTPARAKRSQRRLLEEVEPSEAESNVTAQAAGDFAPAIPVLTDDEYRRAVAEAAAQGSAASPADALDLTPRAGTPLGSWTAGGSSEISAGAPAATGAVTDDDAGSAVQGDAVSGSAAAEFAPSALVPPRTIAQSQESPLEALDAPATVAAPVVDTPVVDAPTANASAAGTNVPNGSAIPTEPSVPNSPFSPVTQASVQDDTEEPARKFTPVTPVRRSRSERLVNESKPKTGREQAGTGMTGTIPIVAGPATLGVPVVPVAPQPTVPATPGPVAPAPTAPAPTGPTDTGRSRTSATSGQSPDAGDDPQPPTGAVGWQSPADRLR